MSQMSELDSFVALSKILTGEKALPKTLAAEYLQRLKAQNAGSMQKVLDQFSQIANDRYRVFEVKRRVAETKEPGKEDLPAMAQQIIRIWYTAEFFPLGPDGKPTATALSGTQQQYYSGLLWNVIQAHAPTDSKQSYGYWTTKP